MGYHPTSLRTVGEVLDWYASHELREFSVAALRERRRQWDLFCGEFGQLPLGQCRRAMLLDFIAGQKRAKSNHTRRRIRATICRPFQAALDAELIDRNPFRGLRIAEGPRGRDWTDQEYMAILRKSRAYFRRFAAFLRFSGARPGEGKKLEWSHVREDLQVIVQSDHKTAHTSNGRPRRIYFNAVLLKLVLWLRRHRTHNVFVFTNFKRRPWTTQALTKHLRDVRKRAGLSREVKLHGGRHTFATHAIMNGVDLATLSELLGHASVKTTEIYLHLVNQRAHLNAAMEIAVGKKGGAR